MRGNCSPINKLKDYSRYVMGLSLNILMLLEAGGVKGDGFVEQIVLALLDIGVTDTSEQVGSSRD